MSGKKEGKGKRKAGNRQGRHRGERRKQMGQIEEQTAAEGEAAGHDSSGNASQPLLLGGPCASRTHNDLPNCA